MADITALVAKLEWADKHVFHLKELRDSWKDGEEARIGIENDPHTGNRIYKVIDIPPSRRVTGRFSTSSSSCLLYTSPSPRD